MSIHKQAATQLKTDINTKKDDAESYARVFCGIRTGVTIALIVFWMPFVVIYLLCGWRYIVAYGTMLVVAAAMIGPLANAGYALKALVTRKTSFEPS
jgi:hypothetical protein